MSAKEERRPDPIGVYEITAYCMDGNIRKVQWTVEENVGFEVTIKTGLEEAALGEEIKNAVLQILDDQEETDVKNALWKKAEEEHPAKQG